MTTSSAGVLLYRVDDNVLRVFIAHMGGPFWARKDERAWSIVKGECADGEDPRVAAIREFTEETGSALPDGELVDLGVFRQSSAKQVHAYALAAEFDAASVRSNTFELEWPPRSGRTQEFPEIDRAAWYDIDTARTKLVKGQVQILDALSERVQGSRPHQ